MTKTENFQLNQWNAADPIRREDFNADNQKIDAALLAGTSVSGSYVSTPDTQINIDLGFRPKLVFIMGSGQSSDGLGILMDGMVLKDYYDRATGHAYMSSMDSGMTDNGFYIGAKVTCLNEIADRVCYYTAVR